MGSLRHHFLIQVCGTCFENMIILLKVIINGALEEVSQENLMGFVEDFLDMELAQRRAEKRKTTVDDLATELERFLNLRSVNCRQLQCNAAALEPATPTAKQIAGQKSLSEVRKFLKGNTVMDYQSFYSQRMTTVEVTLVEDASVTKNQCERLIVKELARKRIPVTHDEESNQVIDFDTIDAL